MNDTVVNLMRESKLSHEDNNINVNAYGYVSNHNLGSEGFRYSFKFQTFINIAPSSSAIIKVTIYLKIMYYKIPLRNENCTS